MAGTPSPSTEAVLQIGAAFNRVDILTHPAGVSFEKARRGRPENSHGGLPVHLIGRKLLIPTKGAAGRPRDLVDGGILKRP